MAVKQLLRPERSSLYSTDAVSYGTSYGMNKVPCWLYREIRTVGVILGAFLVLLFGAQFAFAAWSPPTAVPPGGNVSAPVNISSSSQVKSGGLWVDSLGATNGLIVDPGNIGIGESSPLARLAVGTQGLAGDGIAVSVNSANSAIFAQQTGAGLAGSFAGDVSWTGTLLGASKPIGFSDAPVKLTDPATLPPADVTAASFSPEGTYLAVGHAVSPFLTIYKRSGDTFTKLANPATLLAGWGYGASFSPDGTYLAIAHKNSPYLTIYKRSGDTFTKLADPSSLPTGWALGASFSPDGTYLAITHAVSPFLTIYKRSGDTFTKLANPATLPPNSGTGVTFSPDGTYLAIAHSGSPYLTIYKRSGDTFTKLANPATLPSNSGSGASFSPDGTYLVISHISSPYVTIYKRSGDTFTKLANPATLPTGNGRSASFSPDGNYLAIGHYNSPYVTIYKRSGDTFTKLANPATLPTGTGYAASFSNDGTYLAIGHNPGPYLTIYKGAGGSMRKLELASDVTAAGGIGFGKELKLYRSGPGTLALGEGGSLDLRYGKLRMGSIDVIDSSRNAIFESVEATSGGFKFPDGSVQTSAAAGDNLGNHTATANLDMNSFNITSAGSVGMAGDLTVDSGHIRFGSTGKSVFMLSGSELRHGWSNTIGMQTFYTGGSERVRITSGGDLTVGGQSVCRADGTNCPSESDPTVLASVKDGITWTEISSRPAGLDDGDDFIAGISEGSDFIRNDKSFYYGDDIRLGDWPDNPIGVGGNIEIHDSAGAKRIALLASGAGSGFLEQNTSNSGPSTAGFNSWYVDDWSSSASFSLSKPEQKFLFLANPNLDISSSNNLKIVASKATLTASSQVSDSIFIGQAGVSGGGIILNPGMSYEVRVTGDFTVTGSKSAVVDTESFGERKLYSFEEASPRFADEGKAALEDGYAKIELDPIFLETIEKPFFVHLTPYGPFMLYVDEIGEDYFTVRSLDNAKDGEFFWMLTAPRKGFGDVRLEEASSESKEDE